MAGKNVRSALTDLLADLTGPDLKRFCRELADPKQVPRITRNKVEGKDHMDVADVVVSTFTEKGAVEKVVEILRKIGCSDEADRLVEETSGQTSQSASTDDMHFVDKHRNVLIQRVSNISIILDDLLDEKVINQEIYDKIRMIPAPQEKMRELYAGPLKAAGKCKEIFYKILQKHEKYLTEELEGKK